ncbi:MAG: hypothetical protein J0I84_00135 [Terrimonas sp.]|nr:hypothetical protein [Terrimonas sp.]OJY92202.1 MAG: hypothetical protein BGP13_08545 [Sphingobacteriales bacterium 40-81]
MFKKNSFLITSCLSFVFLIPIVFDSSAQIFTATKINPTDITISDGQILLHGFAINTAYSVSYVRDGVNIPATTINSNVNGVIVISGLVGATYSNFSVLDPATNSTQNLVITIKLEPDAIATQSVKFFGAVYGNFTGIKDDTPESFWQVHARLSQPIRKLKGISTSATRNQRFILFRNFLAQLTYSNTTNFKTYSFDTLNDRFTNPMDLLAHSYFNGSLALNIVTYVAPKYPGGKGDLGHIYFDLFSSYVVSNVTDTLTKDDPATTKAYSVKSFLVGGNIKAAFLGSQWNIEGSCKGFLTLPWSSSVNAILSPQTNDVRNISLAQNIDRNLFRSGNRFYTQFELHVQYNTGKLPEGSGGKESKETNNSNIFLRFISTTNWAGLGSKYYPNNYWQIQLGYALDITKLFNGEASPSSTP